MERARARHSAFASALCLISVAALLPSLGLADDGDNFFAVNGFSVGPETTTPEFDYASRGQKKFGDKCENTLECGFPGSICDPKKKSCQCTEDLHVTNHFDKCGKAAAVNESCWFNEQCEAVYFQTECRDGRCICRFEMSPIWGKDGSVECKGRQDKRGPETYIDPAMIGVLVGMALMFIIICVVLRLFSQARWRENRTIFNTPNPRLMNVSLLRDSKLLHGQERRGSRMSVRAPSRQPSMASLRPHSPNPSLGKTGRMTRSKSNTRSSDSRVSDVSNCSRLLEHPSAASQHNVVHSHFLPYVPTTTAAASSTNASASTSATRPIAACPPEQTSFSPSTSMPKAAGAAHSLLNSAQFTGRGGSQSESRGSASNASATSVRSNRSNSVAPGKVSSAGHHERHGSSHRQHHAQLQSPQEQASLITNITTNPVAESVTVEIIEPGTK
ncbi:CG14509 [Drosophila busckii]|uniref:CG14509 n=1 Tax=Drosophila busckii TaxID=30019 RepID=A0A0M4EJL8_DROBS|nr:CG14509 [Drosophila busckii]